MKHAVIGLGRIGLPFLATLKHLYPSIELTIGVDVNKDLIAGLKEGRFPFEDEQGLKTVWETNTPDVLETLDGQSWEDAEILWLCLPSPAETPTKYLREVLTEVKSRWKHNGTGLIMVRSTLPTGICEELSQQGLPLVHCPEFTVQGRAVRDMRYPSRMVFGLTTRVEREHLTTMGLETPSVNCPVIVTSSSASEASKLLANNLLAARLQMLHTHTFMLHKVETRYLDYSFEQAAQHIQDMVNIVGADPRIGRLYLSPSFGYGGGCLPKDLAISGALLKQLSCDDSLSYLADSNQKLIQAWAARIVDVCDECFTEKVAILSEGFSEFTNDTRNDPAADLANYLTKMGYDVALDAPLDGPSVVVVCRRRIWNKIPREHFIKSDDCLRLVDLTFAA